MKVTFLSEAGFTGKIPRTFENARTEYAWYLALDAEHVPIPDFRSVSENDVVFIILPKLRTHLSADSTKIGERIQDVKSSFYDIRLIDELKSKNKKVYIIQEGPNWMFNDYEVEEQFAYFNCIMQADGIFVHNEIDKKFFVGLTYGQKDVHIIPTLMIEDTLTFDKNTEDKTIVGGNFSRWYGGFQSFIVARVFQNDIWTQTSHAMRDGEPKIKGLQHFPRLTWLDWMKNISTFKYAVHLMPTTAAGTFSLNCAYYGVPCIGNKDVDTQAICHPDLAVDVNDIDSAVRLAIKLRDDKDFYTACSETAKMMYEEHYTEAIWKSKILDILK